jgi:hypothetical protein
MPSVARTPAPDHPRYSEAELIECRRNISRYARSFLPGLRAESAPAGCRVASRPVQEQENSSAHTRLKAPATAVDRCYFTRGCILQTGLDRGINKSTIRSALPSRGSLTQPRPPSRGRDPPRHRRDRPEFGSARLRPSAAAIGKESGINLFVVPAQRERPHSMMVTQRPCSRGAGARSSLRRFA